MKSGGRKISQTATIMMKNHRKGGLQLDFLKQLLQSGKIDQETFEALKKLFEGKQKALEEWEAKYKELEAKYQETHKSYEEVLKSKENFESELKSIDEKLAKAKEEGKKELIAELEAQKKEKEELLAKLQNVEAEARTLKIENALKNALGAYEVLSPDVVAAALRVKLDLVDGEVKFQDGKSVEEGVKAFFEAHPELLKAKGAPGSGAGAGGTGGGEPKTLTEKHLMLAKQKGLV